MPPDPILALLSVVGLFVYGLIGSVVGVLWVKFVCERNNDLSQIAAWESSRERDSFMSAAVFWPVVSVPLLIMGLCFGPSQIAKRVGIYVAGSLDK